MEERRVRVEERIDEGPASSTNTQQREETLLQRHSPQRYSKGIQGLELSEF